MLKYLHLLEGGVRSGGSVRSIASSVLAMSNCRLASNRCLPRISPPSSLLEGRLRYSVSDELRSVRQIYTGGNTGACGGDSRLQNPLSPRQYDIMY